MDKKIIYRLRDSVRGVPGKWKFEYQGHGGQRVTQWWLGVGKAERKKAEFDSIEEATEHINEFEKNKGRAYEITILTTEDEAKMKPAKAEKTTKAPKAKKVKVSKADKKAVKKGVKLPTKRSKKIEAPVEDLEVSELEKQVALALAEESKVA